MQCSFLVGTLIPPSGSGAEISVFWRRRGEKVERSSLLTFISFLPFPLAEKSHEEYKDTSTRYTDLKEKLFRVPSREKECFYLFPFQLT